MRTGAFFKNHLPSLIKAKEDHQPPSRVVHCCTLSLFHLGSEIITEIQISIQRSSSGLLTTSRVSMQLLDDQICLQLLCQRRQGRTLHLGLRSRELCKAWPSSGCNPLWNEGKMTSAIARSITRVCDTTNSRHPPPAPRRELVMNIHIQYDGFYITYSAWWVLDGRTHTMGLRWYIHGKWTW